MLGVPGLQQVSLTSFAGLFMCTRQQMERDRRRWHRLQAALNIGRLSPRRPHPALVWSTHGSMAGTAAEEENHSATGACAILRPGCRDTILSSGAADDHVGVDFAGSAGAVVWAAECGR
jgi:hypothetical protein